MGGEMLFTHPGAPVPPRTTFEDTRRARFTTWWNRRALPLWNNAVLLVCLASAVCYVTVTYEANTHIPWWAMGLEIVFGTFFALDYLCRLYAADDRWAFAINGFNVLDLLTVLPALVFIAVPEADVTRRFVIFFQVLRVIRLVRILRNYRAAPAKSRSGDPRSVRNQVLVLCYTLLALIFISAALVQLVEGQRDMWQVTNVDGSTSIDDNSTSPLASFHDSIYLMIITLTTVGYGDLSPETFIGKLFVMIFVVVSLVVIPMETGKISALLALTSPYGGTYVPTERHIIVAGHVEFANLSAFLAEFFHPAHGRNQPYVIVIGPGRPSRSLRVILESGLYSKRVRYLEGSMLDEHDLDRVAYSEALACFFLADRWMRDNYVADCETNMRVRSVKNHSSYVPVFAQLNHDGSRIEAVQSGVDYFICLSGLKQQILALSSQVHGFSTLFCNLFRNEADDAFNAEAGGAPWLEEYCHGISYEVYTMEFSHVFIGKPFGVVSSFVYAQYNTLLLGVNRHNPTTGDSQVLLNPWSADEEFILERGDVGFVFATDSDVPRQISEYEGDLVLTEADLQHHVPGRAEDLTTLDEDDDLGPHAGRLMSRTASSVASAFGVREGRPGSARKRKQAKADHVDAGMPDPDKTAASPSYRKSSFAVSDPPIAVQPRPSLTGELAAAGVKFVPALEVVPDGPGKVADPVDSPPANLPPLVPIVPAPSQGAPSLSGPHASHQSMSRINPRQRLSTASQRPLPLSGHTIVVFPVTATFATILVYVKILRKGFEPGSAKLRDADALRLLNPLLIMAPCFISAEQQAVLLAYPDVHLHFDSGKSPEGWTTCAVADAQTVLILRNEDNTPQQTGDHQTSSDHALMGDFDSLSVWFALEAAMGRSWKTPFVITELAGKENVKYFRPRHNPAHGVITQSNDYIVPAYASGRVYCDAGIDSLLCQVFYNPHLFLLLQQFLNPRRTPTAGGFVSCSMFSMTVPPAWVGVPFVQILQELVLGPHRWLPLGLYRRSESERAEPGRRAASSHRGSTFTACTDGELHSTPSYVFICPPPDTVLRSDDLVYVFADRDPRLVYGGVFTGPTSWPPSAAATHRNTEQSERDVAPDAMFGSMASYVSGRPAPAERAAMPNPLAGRPLDRKDSLLAPQVAAAEGLYCTRRNLQKQQQATPVVAANTTPRNGVLSPIGPRVHM
eukprot:TRINITY_DN16650_c0_g1_i1.p1 TRINITY_DN16650_c0_g1~~TRINITY_DN16650_c0_g1_i1.p1  ORF type:complete len:1188 (+),score=309.68 TRINITY_DN16650_c0_g1_i1:94-3657(+)